MDTRTQLLAVGLGASAVLYVLSRTDAGALVVANATDAVLGTMKRGIRNNNPGNIDWIADAAKRWNGMYRKETAAEGGRFGVFDKPSNGVRAIAKELLLDDSRGFRTINGLIGNWAPPSENNTAAYAAFVSDYIGIDERETFNVRQQLPVLVAAIIKKENGVQPYPMDDLAKWVYLS